MKIMLFALLLIAPLPLAVAAETLHVSETTSISFEIPEGWQWAKQPPEQLQLKMAEHIAHEAAEKGYTPSQQQLLDAARKRLMTNEVLLYNPLSSAHMTIDLSRLQPQEKAPSKRNIQLSAKYAGQSLEQEEGVKQLQGSAKKYRIGGAWYAYRYDAEYLHHEEKMNFSGIIGFAAPNWFFFYYTDYLTDSADRGKAEQVFKTIQIEIK